MQSRENITFVVDELEDGQRLDRVCASRHPGLSRNQIQIVNDLGGITVDGVSRPDSYQLSAGERVEVRAGDVRRDGWNPEDEPGPEDIPFKIVYQDDDIVVVNKPAGLVVHPAHGNPGGTLVNALLGRGVTLSTLGSPQRPGIVHRLDKHTSGLMVVARTDAAYTGLVKSLKDRTVRKEYHAIVRGNVSRSPMTVDAPIGRHPVQRQKMTVPKTGGKEAVSQLFVVDSYSHFDYIRVAIYTGRTHQIRVHMYHVSHPLLGDPVYGGRQVSGRSAGSRTGATYEKLSKIMTRQALHASLLSFSHPVTELQLTFKAALPEDMRLALETLYKEDRIKEV
jgi:23S rRNA pseudouridine1911/1915/1917 synthase